jgi:threonine dehydrogenase-like Zn-dependent dehydrogenase
VIVLTRGSALDVSAVVQSGPREIGIRSFPLSASAAVEPGCFAGVLEVEACGMCSSDYEQYEGTLKTTVPTLYPIIPGHEIVGRIHALSDAAAARWGRAVGDRVAVEAVVSCGSCGPCSRGLARFCVNRFVHGHAPTSEPGALWGGYAEYMLLKDRTQLIPLPDTIRADPTLFNPLGAGIDWVCQAAGTRLGDTVVIYGAGQRGIACVVAAREAGAARIVVVGRRQSHWRLAVAERFGATRVVDSEDDVIGAVREITDGAMADQVIETSSGSLEPISQAMELVRPEGVIVLAGVKAAPMQDFWPDRVFAKALTLRGVFGVSDWAKEQAVRLLCTDRYPWAELTTHTVALTDIARGMQLISHADPAEHVLHVTVVTDDAGPSGCRNRR